MATEYEDLLQEMLDERKAKLDRLLAESKGEEDREVRDIVSDMRFIEVELNRYKQGLALFRTKNLPKVGRWGKPEVESGHREAAPP